MGVVPTSIGFLIIMLGFSRSIYSYYVSKKINRLLPIIIWILATAPYLIYDPALFYPRHIMISLLLLSLNLDKVFFEEVNYRVDKN